MIRLLLIEDDSNLSYIIRSSLEDIIGGYEVVIAINGEEGIKKLKEHNPDIIASDIEMPTMNGIDMVKEIRRFNTEIPIIFTTGRDSAKDVTIGYQSGVNNYIKKPFLPEELDAHIRALLELKLTQNIKRSEKEYKIGNYTFSPNLYIIDYNSEKQKLSFRESQILVLLCENKGKIVLREDILNKYWGVNDYFTSRSLDVFISKIRKYLSKDKSISITNIKSVGLILQYD